ncbi:hypothetical protein DPMN_011623 [Dreissena polymorpha]|uniref:Concentrative nucleoside transporter N-terminal domain-containing protein n=1 Tax=Dreissena polymorpha TaxID=45954 RepID=A0A9D4N4G0_DREPO|nr:hypothetical protein DPMN_011623 [Dreissena polymorpha]
MEVITNARQFVNNHHEKISVAFKVSLLLGYLVYFGFAVFHKFGDEESIRLVVVTTFGIFLIVWNAFKRTRFYKSWDMFVEKLLDEYSKGKRSLIVRWFLYVSMTLFLVVYVIVFVALRKPENLRSLMGLVAFPFMLWLTSNNRCKVNWHTVYWAMTLQFLMALIIYKTTWGAALIQWWGSRLTDLIDNARAGSVFMFGKTYTDHRFVMANVPQMLLLIVSLSVLTYLGVIRFVVETLGPCASVLPWYEPSRRDQHDRKYLPACARIRYVDSRVHSGYDAIAAICDVCERPVDCRGIGAYHLHVIWGSGRPSNRSVDNVGAGSLGGLKAFVSFAQRRGGAGIHRKRKREVKRKDAAFRETDFAHTQPNCGHKSECRTHLSVHVFHYDLYRPSRVGQQHADLVRRTHWSGKHDR